MNRWMVYEFLKKRYMETGYIPELQEVVAVFPKVDLLEITEGIEEFKATISWPGSQIGGKAS